MRNYYVQIHDYLQKLISSIIEIDQSGINTNGSFLSIRDLLILKLLGDGKGKKMFEVMETLNIDRNSFKTIVSRLVFHGYIEKNRSTEDRRAYFLELTDTGRQVFEEILDKEKNMLFSLLNDFTFNEEKAILKFLVKLDMLNKEKK